LAKNCLLPDEILAGENAENRKPALNADSIVGTAIA
jgi:hypothetical protein